MSIILRVILLLGSAGTFFYIIRKIRKSQVQIADMCFWVFFSLILIIIASFPEIAIFMAQVLQIATTVNFVFLVVIFLLLIQIFSLSIRVSKLDSKVKELAGEVALKNYENDIKAVLKHEKMSEQEKEIHVLEDEVINKDTNNISSKGE